MQEASKAREAKLRQTGLKERLKLAFQLKIMDDEVLKLTRLLAVIPSLWMLGAELDPRQVITMAIL